MERSYNHATGQWELWDVDNGGRVTFNTTNDPPPKPLKPPIKFIQNEDPGDEDGQ